MYTAQPTLAMNADVHFDILDERTVRAADDWDRGICSVQRHDTNSIEESVASTSIARYRRDSKQIQTGMVDGHEQSHRIVMSRVTVKP